MSEVDESELEFLDGDLDSLRKQEKDLLENEYSLHRWYRSKSEKDSWRIPKMLLTMVIGLQLGASGFYFLNTIYNSLIGALFVGINILVLILLINQQIRSAFLGLFKNSTKDTINVHDHVGYYFLKGHEDVIFIQTAEEFRTFGVFEIKAVPLNIMGNLERFMKGLYEKRIPLFWTFAQSTLQPPVSLDNPPASLEDREVGDQFSAQDPVLFESSPQNLGVVQVFFGPLCRFRRSKKWAEAYQEVASHLLDIGTLFRSAYPHLTLEHLKGDKIVDAFGVLLTCGALLTI